MLQLHPLLSKQLSNYSVQFYLIKLRTVCTSFCHNPAICWINECLLFVWFIPMAASVARKIQIRRNRYLKKYLRHYKTETDPSFIILTPCCVSCSLNLCAVQFFSSSFGMGLHLHWSPAVFIMGKNRPAIVRSYSSQCKVKVHENH